MTNNYINTHTLLYPTHPPALSDWPVPQVPPVIGSRSNFFLPFFFFSLLSFPSLFFPFSLFPFFSTTSENSLVLLPVTRFVLSLLHNTQDTNVAHRPPPVCPSRRLHRRPQSRHCKSNINKFRHKYKPSSRTCNRSIDSIDSIPSVALSNTTL